MGKKNLKGGKNFKKQAKKSDSSFESKELLLADNITSIYGQVTCINGGGIFQVLTIDGISRRGHIRGKDKIGIQRRNNNISVHCLVLVDLREFLSSTKKIAIVIYCINTVILK